MVLQHKGAGLAVAGSLEVAAAGSLEVDQSQD